MEKVYTPGLMDRNMMDNGKEEWNMEKELIFMLMEESMKESGKVIIGMVKVA
jgi:hypothetical protein